jgi:DNA-binding response OmpR family regulator
VLALPHQPPHKLFATPARRVLVADGDVDAADRLTLLLRAEGCRVSVCYDGPTALLMARACRPEVALLGLEVPGLPGREVARRLRQDAFA